MDALEISTFGEPSDVVEQVTIPDPDSPIANEVLVAVEYAPIDNADFRTIRGQYGTLPSLPTGLGIEGVGRILSVGEEVDHLKVGDRVLLPSSHHSWRERLVLPSTNLFPLPQGADPQQLSMLGINPPTAALLLSEYVKLSPGDWVIQNAGNSGVGHSVIAFAKVRGLRTVSLVRRPELIDGLVAAGGDVVLVDGAIRSGGPGHRQRENRVSARRRRGRSDALSVQRTLPWRHAGGLFRGERKTWSGKRCGSRLSQCDDSWLLDWQPGVSHFPQSAGGHENGSPTDRRRQAPPAGLRNLSARCGQGSVRSCPKGREGPVQTGP
jgi:Alcohol dehydrogenase GroES-like domain